MCNLSELKAQVFEANLMLVRHNLVKFTWGNASGICREKNLVVIKPSGVEYEAMAPADMVVVDLFTGRVAEEEPDTLITESKPLKPSSDTPTHLELYRRFPDIGGVVHTHSRYATIFAQARREIPALGTTHADYFRGAIPCTRLLSPQEIAGDYELETGKLIAETARNHAEIPGVLVAAHGPFTWGRDARDAAFNSVVLEEVAFMAWENLKQNPAAPPMPQELLDKHFLRKHGADAYYGQ